MADLTLPPLPQPKARRHLMECAVFDPSPGRCDCGSPPKVYDALEMESYARRAVEGDRAARGVPVCGQGFKACDGGPECKSDHWEPRGVEGNTNG